MALIRDDSGRLHIDTPLMAESLMDKKLLANTQSEHIFRPLPDLNVIKLGGQSIIDRGSKAVLPILQEIIAVRTQYQLLLMTGGGTLQQACLCDCAGSRHAHRCTCRAWREYQRTERADALIAIGPLWWDQNRAR